MFITKTSLARRTFLRGMGAAVGAAGARSDGPRVHRDRADTPRARRLRFGAVFVPNGAIMEQWIPSAPGAGFEFTPILKPLERFQRLAGRRQQPDARASRRRRGGPRDQRRGLADRRAGRSGREAEDVQGGHDDRSDHRQADRAGHAVPVARAGDGGFHRLRRARARAASAARTRTRSRGARRRRRCRWRSTRAWCSSGCSAGRGRRRSARRACSGTSASSIWSRSEAAELQRGLGTRDRARLERVSGQHPRDRAAHSANRSAQQHRGDVGRRAGRHAGVVRGAPGADVRPAGRRLSGGPDARVHVHDAIASSASGPIRRSA